VSETTEYEVTVGENDTVAALIKGMPPVAATPYLVTIAELACFEHAAQLLEPGLITVGAYVAIEHLGPSKVGAKLLVRARLSQREGRKFTYSFEIVDGDRVVARGEHRRAAVSFEKMMSALS
jgi:fluoroacetyl-CoA thioesterase